MPAPTPKSKASEVIDQVNALIVDAGSYLSSDDINFRRLKREAEAAIRADASAGHSALACVYQLTGDAEHAIYHLDNAIRIDPGQPVHIKNKCTILANLGYFSECQRVFNRAANPELGFMSLVWPEGYACAAFQSMRRLLEKARIMKLDLGSIDTSTAESAARILDSLGVGEAELGTELDIFGKVLRGHRLFFLGQAPRVAVFDQTGYAPFIRMIFDVAVPPKEANGLYREFVDRLTELMAEPAAVLSLAFRSGFKKHEHSTARSA